MIKTEQAGKEAKDEVSESLTALMNKFNDLISKYKYTTHLCNDMKEAIGNTLILADMF